MPNPNYADLNWDDDEAVVRAAVPTVVCGHWTGNGLWVVEEGNGSMVILGSGSDKYITWRLARKHDTVQAFERLHNPKLRQPDNTADAAFDPRRGQDVFCDFEEFLVLERQSHSHQSQAEIGRWQFLRKEIPRRIMELQATTHHQQEKDDLRQELEVMTESTKTYQDAVLKLEQEKQELVDALKRADAMLEHKGLQIIAGGVRDQIRRALRNAGVEA